MRKYYACMHDELVIHRQEFSIISNIHNSIIGHFGVEKTMQKLIANKHNWSQMREHVKRFVKTCPCCQKMNQIKVPIHTQRFTASAYEPMERLNIVSIGPLSAEENGNTYIIVIFDCFNRWVEIYATKDATAKFAAKALTKHVGRYGQPSQILSDNGTHYANAVIKKLLKLLGTNHK